MKVLDAEIRTRKCYGCGERPAIRAEVVSADGYDRTTLTRLCALCLARVIDAAYGWKIASNVAQGLVASELGQEIRERKRAARAAS